MKTITTKPMRLMALMLSVLFVLALAAPAGAAVEPKYTTELIPDKTELTVLVGGTGKIKVTAMATDNKADIVQLVKPAPDTIKVTGKTGLPAVFTVKGLKEGTYTLTIRSKQTTGPKVPDLEIPITVLPKKAPTVTGLTLDVAELTLKKGEKHLVGWTVEPAHPKQKKPVWKSLNPKIASVGSKGRILAKKPGEAVIQARIKGTNPLIVREVKVTVVPKDYVAPAEPADPDTGSEEAGE